MDVICPTCGEPYDFDELHNEAQLRHASLHEHQDRTYEDIFKEVSGEFRSAGCRALTGITEGKACTPVQGPAGDRALMARAAYEACGDDMDGAAAILEDFMA